MKFVENYISTASLKRLLLVISYYIELFFFNRVTEIADFMCDDSDGAVHSNEQT